MGWTVSQPGAGAPPNEADGLWPADLVFEGGGVNGDRPGWRLASPRSAELEGIVLDKHKTNFTTALIAAFEDMLDGKVSVTGRGLLIPTLMGARHPATAPPKHNESRHGKR